MFTDLKVIHDVNQWASLRHTFPPERNIGFVPTMGNLHEGHVSLIKQSQKDNDITVVSIFVNQLQFNHIDDYTHYPRTPAADLTILENEQVQYCLMPLEADMYSDDKQYTIHEKTLSKTMEGLSRPGHFEGMLTIVMKLLQLVKPHRLYMGEKDYQQSLLVSGMLKAFFMDIELIICDTIRDRNGLACSSRNHRLSADEYEKAVLFARLFHQKEHSINTIKQALLRENIDVDYLIEQHNRRLIAVRIGSVRLIDNYII